MKIYYEIPVASSDKLVIAGANGSIISTYLPSSGSPYYSELTFSGNKLYFSATDAVNGDELWSLQSDGPRLFADLNPGSANSSPYDLTNINGELYFFTAGYELWKADGANGVSPLATVPGYTRYAVSAHVGTPFQVPPDSISSANGQTYFMAGSDTPTGGTAPGAGVTRGLWTSDGTAAGTFLLSGNLYDYSSTQLDNQVIVTFVGGLLYFFTIPVSPGGSSGQVLSVSNGAATGTTTIALPSGISDAQIVGANEAGVFFSAFDNSLSGFLYYYNVKAGTFTQVGTFNAPINYAFGPSVAINTGVSSGSLLYFLAEAPGTDIFQLWDSNGTSTGTQQLTNVTSGPNTGVNVSIANLTAVGDNLYFTYGTALCVTDGTSSGTRVVVNMGFSGFSAVYGLTAAGDTLFFEALNSSNLAALYRLGPTDSAPVLIGQGLDPYVPFAVGISQNTNDFNGDGTSDVLLTVPGAAVAWQVKNGEVTQGASLGGVAAGYSAVATGDFNGDGTSDILFENLATGGLADWMMDNGSVSEGHFLGAAQPGWQVVATGDLVGDGTDDILFQNAATGGVVEWTMQYGTVAGGSYLGAAAPGWNVVGAGDFYGDGSAEILFQNASTGGVVDWSVKNGVVSSGSFLGAAQPGWKVVGVGDFNGDGTSDILFQNAATGGVVDWLMKNNKVIGGGLLGTAGAGWSVVGVGDYNGDGTSDVLFQNPSTGGVLAWLIKNDAVSAMESLSGGTAGWRVT